MRRTPFLKRTLDQSQPTRSWQLLAYLSNPESLQGEARRLVEAEAKCHRTRDAALAHAVINRASQKEKDRPNLRTCVVCARYYKCDARCFPRVMLERGRFVEGTHAQLTGRSTNTDVKTPCPSLLYGPADKAADACQKHMASESHQKAVRELGRFPRVAEELRGYEESVRGLKTRARAAFEQQAAKALQALLADPTSKQVHVDALSLSTVGAPPKCLCPPSVPSLPDALVSEHVLRGEDVHALLPQFVQVATLEAAAQVPIVRARALRQEEWPCFLGPAWPTAEIEHMLGHLRNDRRERLWCNALLSCLYIVRIASRGAVAKERAVEARLARLFPNAHPPYFVPASRCTACVLFETEKEARSCVDVCCKKKTLEAVLLPAHPPDTCFTKTDVAALPVSRMHSELRHFAVYTFRFGENCTAQAIVHERAFAGSAYRLLNNVPLVHPSTH